MAERLVLTPPIPGPILTEWHILDLSINIASPSIKISVMSNLGEKKAIRYTPHELEEDPEILGESLPEDPKSPTEETVLKYIRSINAGEFRTIHRMSLIKWLLKKMSDDGFLESGTVSGTPD